jgi:hypothetical protein
MNRGALTATNLYVGYQTFNLNAVDAVTNYSLNVATSTLNNSVASLVATISSATTTAAGNVAGNVDLTTSTLNLGANMTLSGALNATANSTLNMNGHTLTAATITVDYYNPGSTTLLNRGALSATNLQVGNQTFNLNAADTVANYSLTNSTSTLNSTVGILSLTNSSNATTVAGNVSSYAYVYTASTLNMGANMTLSGTMEVRDNSTLNMNGHTLTANLIDLGYATSLPTTLLNRGTLTATALGVGNQTFNLNATDTVTQYYLNNATTTLNSSVALLYAGGSQITTTAAGNVTGDAHVGGSTLNLGANMTLTGTMNIGSSTFNMNGHTLMADTIALDAVALVNRGALKATTLYVESQTFNLSPADTVTNYSVYDATSALNSSVVSLVAQNLSHATTTTAGTVTGSVQLLSASTLTLGANMTLSGSMDVEYNSTLDMGGHSLTADTIYVGHFDDPPASVINNGGIQALNLYLGRGSGMTMHSDDVLNALLSITGNSTLTVLQANGQLTGLTLNGNVAGDLSILDTSVLDLAFGNQSFPNWIFRWADPTGGGNWDAALANLISGGRIVISAPNGYSILDQSGYTYIEGGVVAPPSTPEPASAALVGLGLIAILILKRRVARVLVQ